MRCPAVIRRPQRKPLECALSIDGKSSNFTTGINGTSGSVTSGSFSAANAGDIAIIWTGVETSTHTGGSPVSGTPTDNTGLSLSWAQRGTTLSVLNNLTYQTGALFWAYVSAAFTTKTFTASWTCPTGTLLDDMFISCYCVSGFTGTAYQTNPWDGNASLQAAGTSSGSTTPTLANISTNSSAGMLIAGITTPGATREASSPGTWTNINNGRTTGGANSESFSSDQQVYASQQSSITVGWNGAATNVVFFVDALTSGSAPPPASTNHFLSLMGVGQ